LRSLISSRESAARPGFYSQNKSLIHQRRSIGADLGINEIRKQNDTLGLTLDPEMMVVLLTVVQKVIGGGKLSGLFSGGGLGGITPPQ
jgi:hypothetical protein